MTRAPSAEAGHDLSLRLGGVQPHQETEEPNFPHASKSGGRWIGWMAAAVALVAFGLFYVTRHVPLQRALAQAQRRGAEQAEEHARAMKDASAQLARTAGEIEELKAVAAAAEAARKEGRESASEPASASARATAREAREARRQAAREARRQAARERAAVRAAAREARQARSAARRAEKAASSNAAETSVTAEVKRRVYQPQPPPSPRPEPEPAQPAPRDALTGVLDDTRDPLHGL